MTDSSPLSYGSREPTSKQLLIRLEKDIDWLKRRDLWTRALFETAVLRYVEARGSTEGLDSFTARHKIAKLKKNSWIPA